METKHVYTFDKCQSIMILSMYAVQGIHYDLPNYIAFAQATDIFYCVHVIRTVA
jgi:hypothetical protein